MRFESQRDPVIDLVTAAVIRLTDGTPVALAVSGIASGPCFALTYFGEEGQLHATDHQLIEEKPDRPGHQVALPALNQTIDSNFIGALLNDTPLCCPAEEALESVRLLEAIARSAAAGQFSALV